MKEIKAIIEQIAQPFRQQLVEGFTANAHATIQRWQKLAAEKGVTDPRHIWPTHGKMGRFDYRMNQACQEAVAPYVKMVPNEKQYAPWNTPRDYAVIGAVEAKIAKKAAEYAEACVAGFIAKMTRKFEGIAEAKGNLTKVCSNGTLGWNSIRFEFADGSSFDAQNSIVSKWSIHGRPFSQFPTTFHNVMLPGGERLKQPSEAKVKKVFVKTQPEANPRPSEALTSAVTQ